MDSHDAADTPQTSISVKGLRVHYGEREVLHGLDFDIFHGETVAVMGGDRKSVV